MSMQFLILFTKAVINKDWRTTRKWSRRSGRKKRIKILTSNKLLNKVPVSLTQIKAGNMSYKLKAKIRQILYL